MRCTITKNTTTCGWKNLPNVGAVFFCFGTAKSHHIILQKTPPAQWQWTNEVVAAPRNLATASTATGLKLSRFDRFMHSRQPFKATKKNEVSKYVDIYKYHLYIYIHHLHIYIYIHLYHKIGISGYHLKSLRLQLLSHVQSACFWWGRHPNCQFPEVIRTHDAPKVQSFRGKMCVRTDSCFTLVKMVKHISCCHGFSVCICHIVLLFMISPKLNISNLKKTCWECGILLYPLVN